MTVTVAQFRADFPGFSDTAKYPDEAVQFWLDIAVQMLPAQLWNGSLDLGTELFTAHNLILDQRAVAAGGVGSFGVVASKSVGAGSLSYDTSIGLEQDAGIWNATLYGARFYRLMRMFGAGGLQL